MNPGKSPDKRRAKAAAYPFVPQPWAYSTPQYLRAPAGSVTPWSREGKPQQRGQLCKSGFRNAVGPAWQKNRDNEKTAALLGDCFQCWRKPIFPGRHQPSIFGAGELNFRVRDGNGWTLAAINTNYSVCCLTGQLQYNTTAF